MRFIPMRPALTIGGLYGLTAIGFGAYAAHGLTLDAHDAAIVQTALTYQLLHAVMLTALGIGGGKTRLLRLAAGLVAGGALFFCGGIYLHILAGRELHGIVPLGGMLLMAGWLALAISGFIGKTATP